ncbi:MAG: tRNA-dihydrouridine synthase, partial [Candidatus Uhrbacteria bacterium]|nr:tRNA-dihydrouridine synthase [Candidatus Uhrbacteria bacterium]
VMIDEWIMPLLDAGPAALTIHARTRKEMSKVPAHWDVLGDVVQKIHAQYTTSRNRPIIIGNGDVKDMEDAHEKVKQYGVDGVMLGRAIFGNPWLFSRGGQGTPPTPILAEKLGTMLEHTLLFDRLFAGIKNFDIMKKHYKAYVSGFDGAKELRVQLMTCKTVHDVANIIHKEFPSL